MVAFAAHVCGAHSWYKHLPLFPPGRPFHFFLDPAAGMDLRFHADHVDAVPRTEPGFHHSSILTADYRERFGHLAFSHDGGTTVYMVGDDGSALAPSDDVPAVYDPPSRSLRRLPAEVLAQGTAMVSGIVHPEGVHSSLVLMFANERAIAAWPIESGGPAAMHELLAYCRTSLEQLRERPRERLLRDDEGLQQRLEPERTRQRQGMVAAMRRVSLLT